MRTKLYYGALALIWLLSSCNDSGYTITLFETMEYVYKDHVYVDNGYGLAHVGHCPQCKQERDSTLRIIIKQELKLNE